MKKDLIKRTASVAILGMALGWVGGTACAQVSSNLFTFDTSATGTWGSWQSEYEGYWDNTVDHTGNGGGSLYWYQDISKGNGVQIFNTWAGPSGTAGSYIDLSAATNISFWVKWDTTYSTLGIDAFNTQSYANPPGWGDSGIVVGIQTAATGAGNQGTALGNAYIPEAASNGWAQVNLSITPGGVSDENQAIGMSLFKWSNTTTSQSGIFAFWIDDIQAEYPGVIPPIVMQPPAAPAAAGLNIYDDGASGDRQSIETVVNGGQNYGWIGNGAPVTYSVTIAQATPTNFIGGQVHIMIMPGTNITELAPDWNETNAMVLFIERQTNGIVGSLRYKLNDAGDNAYLFGSATNIFGGSGLGWTNTIVAGYGGLLVAATNASANGYIGTWSVKMASDTTGQLIYPGGSANFSFPQASDAQAFAGPVSVYWGVQPNTSGWFQDTVLSSVAITGSATTLNADLTHPLNSSQLIVNATMPTLVFPTPANAVYWLKWAPPNSSFTLQSAPSVLGPWANVIGSTTPTTNFVETFDSSNFLVGASRTYNPPPIWIGYDSGDDSSLVVNWVAGPTYDAGGSAGSGSVQLSWNFAGGSGDEAITVDTFGSAQTLNGGTLSFDLMIDASSTPGTNNDYGYFAVVTRDGDYNWHPTSVAGPLLTMAGGSVGQWAHVTVPLDQGTNSIVRALTFQDSDDGNITGPETIYIDNIRLLGAGVQPPPVYNIDATNAAFITTSMLPSSGAGFFRLAK